MYQVKFRGPEGEELQKDFKTKFRAFLFWLAKKLAGLAISFLEKKIKD